MNLLINGNSQKYRRLIYAINGVYLKSYSLSFIYMGPQGNRSKG